MLLIILKTFYCTYALYSQKSALAVTIVVERLVDGLIYDQNCPKSLCNENYLMCNMDTLYICEHKYHNVIFLAMKRSLQ